MNGPHALFARVTVNTLGLTGTAAGAAVRAAVGPDLSGVAAAGDLSRIVGALLTVALIVSVATLVVCAVTWAIATGTGSWHTAARARTGVLVAVGGAALTGAALAWANWLLHTGPAL